MRTALPSTTWDKVLTRRLFPIIRVSGQKFLCTTRQKMAELMHVIFAARLFITARSPHISSVITSSRVHSSRPSPATILNAVTRQRTLRWIRMAMKVGFVVLAIPHTLLKYHELYGVDRICISTRISMRTECGDALRGR